VVGVRLRGVAQVQSDVVHRLALTSATSRGVTQTATAPPTHELAPLEHAPLPADHCELRCATMSLILCVSDPGKRVGNPGRTESCPIPTGVRECWLSACRRRATCRKSICRLGWVPRLAQGMRHGDVIHMTHSTGPARFRDDGSPSRATISVPESH
jgi:hypothetical protein